MGRAVLEVNMGQLGHPIVINGDFVAASWFFPNYFGILVSTLQLHIFLPIEVS